MIKIRDRLWISTISFLVFLFIFATRVPYINNYPCEQGEYWRQSDTESIARNFIDDRFNILYPQFNYDGKKPNYVQLEFQITTFLIAILYKVFGIHYFLARLVPITFFLGSSIYIYLIGKKYYGREAGWFSAIAYSIMPLNIFFSRTIMPESAALFFFTAAFYYFIKWQDDENLKYLFISAIFTSLSISQKTPTIFIGLAMILLLIKKYKLKFLLKWESWIFAIIALVPNIIYFIWSKGIAKFDFVNKIGLLHIVPKAGNAFLQSDNYIRAAREIGTAVSLGLIPLFIIALLDIEWKKDYPLLFWTIAMFIEIIAIASVIKLRYYYIFITPVAALWIGKTLSNLVKSKRSLIAVFFGLSIITLWNYIDADCFFKEKDNILKQSAVIDRYTNKDDLIIIGTQEPALLNQSRRSGWRANIKYYEGVPTEAKEEIQYYIDLGAKYFSPLGGTIFKDDGSYKKYLDDNFERLGDEEYYIYKLR